MHRLLIVRTQQFFREPTIHYKLGTACARLLSYHYWRRGRRGRGW